MNKTNSCIFYLWILSKLKDNSIQGTIALNQAYEVMSFLQIKKILVKVILEEMVQQGLLGRCGKGNSKLIINETPLMKKNPDFYNNMSLMYEYIGAIKQI